MARKPSVVGLGKGLTLKRTFPERVRARGLNRKFRLAKKRSDKTVRGMVAVIRRSAASAKRKGGSARSGGFRGGGSGGQSR